MLENAETSVFVVSESSRRSKYLFRRAKIERPLGKTPHPPPQRKRLKRFYVRMLSFVEGIEICPINPEWKPSKEGKPSRKKDQGTPTEVGGLTRNTYNGGNTETMVAACG